MNDYEQQLRSKWNSINYYNGGSIRLSLNHSLEWHVGYFTETQKAVIIISDFPVINVESSKSIIFSCNIRQDGKYAIAFSLTSREQEDVYITMCSDMIQYSIFEKDPQSALILVIRRYKQWIRLLEHQKNILLSNTAQKGLIGELLYLKEKLNDGFSVIDAVAGWVGPEGADQDFVYSDGWHEIKSTGVSSAEIQISSVEQLDNYDIGELIVIRVDKCAPEQSDSFTLFALVHELITMISNNVDALESFINKLNCVGYIDLPEYDQQKFFYSSEQVYAVKDDFPRIRRSNLSANIVNCHYTLNLPGLIEWIK